jgi:hypothetical protein
LFSEPIKKRLQRFSYALFASSRERLDSVRKLLQQPRSPRQGRAALAIADAFAAINQNFNDTVSPSLQMIRRGSPSTQRVCSETSRT